MALISHVNLNQAQKYVISAVPINYWQIICNMIVKEKSLMIIKIAHYSSVKFFTGNY